MMTGEDMDNGDDDNHYDDSGEDMDNGDADDHYDDSGEDMDNGDDDDHYDDSGEDMDNGDDDDHYDDSCEVKIWTTVCRKVTFTHGHPFWLCPMFIPASNIVQRLQRSAG